MSQVPSYSPARRTSIHLAGGVDLVLGLGFDVRVQDFRTNTLKFEHYTFNTKHLLILIRATIRVGLICSDQHRAARPCSWSVRG